MTTLLLASLRARLGVALMTFALAALATAAAAVGPIYQNAARQAILTSDVDAVSVEERVISGTRGLNERNRAGLEEPGYPYIEGFTTVNSIESVGWFKNWVAASVGVAARSGLCEHLSLSKGRCPVADREIAIRDDTARKLGLDLGSELVFNGVEDSNSAKVGLTVVGLYRALNPSDLYWAHRPTLITSVGGPVFATQRTVENLPGLKAQGVDLLSSPQAFADTDRLRAEVTQVGQVFSAGSYSFDTRIDELIIRVHNSGAVLDDSLLVAAIPLVLLCWFLLFLAMTSAVDQRRDEIGLIALRGVPNRQRWVLASLESVVPVLAGAIPGYLVGYLGALLIGKTFLHGDVHIAASGESMLYAALAVLGALIAGMVAQTRALTTPVLSLLRRVRRAHRHAAMGVLEAVVGTLAVAAGYQAAVAGEDAGGVGLLAPLCVALGLGLLAARLVSLVSERLGRSALRRGRLRVGLASLSLARRPGTGAVTALLTVVFGLLGFAATAADTASQAWTQRAQVEVAANEVVSVTNVTPRELIKAVSTVDPKGEFAMGVAEVPMSIGPRLLAVDTTRLASVATWLPEYGALTASDVAKALHPVAPTPLLLQGAKLKLDLTLASAAPGAQVALRLRLIEPDGDILESETDTLALGRHDYVIKTPKCVDQACQLDQIEVRVTGSGVRQTEFTIGAITDDTGKVQADLARIADPAKWVLPFQNKPQFGTLSRTDAGLKVDVNAQTASDMRLFPQVLPFEVPLVSVGDLPETQLRGHLGVTEYQAVQAGKLDLGPRWGDSGALVDLGYAEVGLLSGGEARNPEVWLNAKAPADVLDKLREAGLIIVDDRTVAWQDASYRKQAPAVALRFLMLAALIAVLIGAGALLVMAKLERDRPDDGLAVLRQHGVKTRTLRAVALGGRVAVLVVGAAAGLLAAGLSWVIAHVVVPVFAGGPSPVKQSLVPDWPAIAPVVLGSAAVLLVTCWIAARYARAAKEGADR